MNQGRTTGILAVLAVLLISGALFLSLLGNAPLSDRDEGEYAAASLAMLKGGDYVVPTLNGQNYLEKPILAFWAVAGSLAAFGVNDWAVRLPSALSALCLVLFMGFLLFRVSRAWLLAAFGMAALAFTPLAVLVGRACLTDMPLTLFTTASLGMFFLASEQPDAPAKGWYLGSWAALGLAFITKGPVALAVVLPTALLYALWQGILWRVLRQGQILWGLLIFVIINAPWYGMIFNRLGNEFWQGFFWSQNLRRFSEVLLGHGGGYFYYLPVLLVGAFPFLPAALSGLGSAVFKNPRARRGEDPLARLRILCALAVLVVLAVFTVAATKQINYIMPGFPFLAALAGHTLWRLSQGEAPGKLSQWVMRWGILLCAAVWALALAAIPIGVPWFWDQIQASIRFDSSEYALPLQAPVLILWPLAGLAVCLGLGWLGAAGLKQGRLRGHCWGLCLGGALFSAALVVGLLGQVSNIIQRPAVEMAEAAVQKADENTTMVTFGLWKPSLFYYTGRNLERVRSDQDKRLLELIAQQEPVMIFTRARLADMVGRTPGFVELGRFGGYLLGGNQKAAALAGMAPPAPAPPEQAMPAPAQPDQAQSAPDAPDDAQAPALEKPAAPKEPAQAEGPKPAPEAVKPEEAKP